MIKLFLNIGIICYLIGRTIVSYATPENFLVITDIHFDPFITCKETPCPLIRELKNQPAKRWYYIFKKHGDIPIQLYEDTNNTLLLESLSQIKNVVKEKRIKFILVLGDVLSHQYRQTYKKLSGDHSRMGYQSFVFKTFSYITSLFSKSVDHVPVFFVVGNNDSYKGNYVVSTNDSFFKDMFTLWGKLSQEDAAIQPLARAGYYAVNLTPKLRLIAINTVLFSNRNKEHYGNTEALSQLTWLAQELKSVQDNHQKALIAMHIPESVEILITYKHALNFINLWKTSYIESYNSILKKHQGDIFAVLFGHLHTNWYQLEVSNNFAFPLAGTGSISPIFGNAPSFNLYTFENEQLKLLSAETFTYILGKAGFLQNLKHLYSPSCQECNLFNGIHFAESFLQKLQLRNYLSKVTIEPQNWKVTKCIMYNPEHSSYQSCSSS